MMRALFGMGTPRGLQKGASALLATLWMPPELVMRFRNDSQPLPEKFCAKTRNSDRRQTCAADWPTVRRNTAFSTGC
jgi:hypothetical protein